MAMRIVKDTPDEDPEESDLLDEYIAARRNFEAAERHFKIKQEELANQMAAAHQKSMTYTKNGRIFGVTFVQRSTYELDEKGLRKALTAKVYDRFTEKKLNRKALEEAMSRQEIDPMVVSKYVEEKKGSPYLRYTEKDAEE